MSTESPLERARRRITQRQADQQSPKIPDSQTPKIEADPAEILLSPARLEYFKKFPEPFRDLIADVQRTIETAENVNLDISNQCEYKTSDPKEIEELIKRGISPIKSASIQLYASKTREGKTHMVTVFGPQGQIPQKDPDVTSEVFLEFTFIEQENKINWIMGNRKGPPIVNNETREERIARQDIHAFFLNIGGHAEGSMSYSEENIEKLAEELVSLIDSRRYKYVVHDEPRVIYPVSA